MEMPILEMKDVSLSYSSVCVATGIDLRVYRGDVLGIAGESGSGKSTLLKTIIDPIGYNVEVINGKIIYKGEDMHEFSPLQYRKIKGSEIAMILQNPYSNFNPVRSYYKQFLETLKSHNRWNRSKSVKKILDVFRELGLEDGEHILRSCPYELSGGMNQRVSIALSVILEPVLLLADEPTSALDVTSASQVISQFQNLQKKYSVSMIIVSHNLSVIAKTCNKIAIMYGGRILEYGDTADVLLNPKHPYTKSLLRAIPKINNSLPEGLDGIPPVCTLTENKCCFFERCPYSSPECQYTNREMEMITQTHYSRCRKRS